MGYFRFSLATALLVLPTIVVAEGLSSDEYLDFFSSEIGDWTWTRSDGTKGMIYCRLSPTQRFLTYEVTRNGEPYLSGVAGYDASVKGWKTVLFGVESDGETFHESTSLIDRGAMAADEKQVKYMSTYRHVNADGSIDEGENTTIVDGADRREHRGPNGFLLKTTRVEPSGYQDGEMKSEAVGKSVPYGLILPAGYQKAAKPYPLLLFMHGGGGSHEDLVWCRKYFDELWAQGRLPKLVVAMATVGEIDIDHRARYMNFKNGPEKWETFLTKEFLEHIRQNYNVSKARADTVIAGVSDGGFGALRIAFKNPDLFSGVAAIEPAIFPAEHWKDVKLRNSFFVAPDLLAKYYGQPIDEDYWAANNPASIAKSNAKVIQDSKLAIYLECGDIDYLNLNEGTEFLHQVLWTAEIPHEYHLVRGEDHLGGKLMTRMQEGLAFLTRALQPPPGNEDQQLKKMKDRFRQLKKAGEKKAPRRFRSGEYQDFQP